MKTDPEDFIVEEIDEDGSIYVSDGPITKPDTDGPFTHFVIQKRGWSTHSASVEIASRLHIQNKRISFAGAKDKNAVTTQRMSAQGISTERIMELKVKDISVLGAWKSDTPVRLGDLLGNRFTIKVKDACDGADKRVEKILEELGEGFPNYFGEQRFGSGRRNTHLIGEKLLKGDLEGAVKEILAGTEGEENREAIEARKELALNWCFPKAAGFFPKHLRIERTLIGHLASKPDDWRGALLSLQRQMLLMYVHAFQSHLFNLMLSDRIAKGPLELGPGEYFCGETLGFPDINKPDADGWICGKIIGYETPLTREEEDSLSSFGLTKESFRMKDLDQISSRGTYRTLLAPLKDFRFHDNTFRFSLQSGAYATMAMREFMKG